MEPHTVRSFDGQLDKLHEMVAQMGILAEQQFARCIDALAHRDTQLAAQVNEDDVAIVALEAAVNEQVIRVLATRAPVADDLRMVVTALKLSSALERVADYAASIARRSLILNTLPAMPSVRPLKRMAQLVHVMLSDSLAAYQTRDPDKALAVWQRDRDVDEQYSGLFRELLTYMMEDSRNITPCSHLLFIAKHVERVGDHATNISEMAYFLVTGHAIDGLRPKADTSNAAGGVE